MKTLLIACVLCLFVGVGVSQESVSPFVPDPNQPGAASIAGMMFGYAWLGMMPPPIGWDCSWEPMNPDDLEYYPQLVECVPNPELIAEQQQQQQEWLERQRRLRDLILGSFRRR